MKKVALVTGSSRGIGKAIALRLAKDGYKIILHASKPTDELKATEKELKKLNKLLMTICFDVSKKAEVERACKQILKKGGVSVLVNNAGIARDKTFLKLSFTEWDEVIQTNLYGMFYVTQELLPQMKVSEYGRIVNISSIAGERGAFGKTNYATSKAGVIGLTKSLAQEVGKYNVTVNVVCPGWIETEMSKHIPEKYRIESVSKTALQRMGRPEEVASLVSYLVSPESSYITGSVIDINGGLM